MFNTRKILICGSSRLPANLEKFAWTLGYRLILNTEYQIITGGLKERAEGISTSDFMVIDGAKKALIEKKLVPRERIITMLPQADVSKVQRFKEGQIIEVQKSNLKSRRYSMVLSCDAVIAICGDKGTDEIIDLAWIAGKPILPIASTAGAAERGWVKYFSDIHDILHLTKDDVEIIETKPIDIQETTNVCINIMKRVLRPLCFIAMPYHGHPLINCYEILSSVVEKRGYAPIRIDHENFTGDIIHAIWDAIRNSEMFIADLTLQNPNVYYELGISHALSKKTLLIIYNKTGNVPSEIPFDIKTQRIYPYDSLLALETQINKNLY